MSAAKMRKFLAEQGENADLAAFMDGWLHDDSAHQGLVFMSVAKIKKCLADPASISIEPEAREKVARISIETEARGKVARTSIETEARGNAARASRWA